MREGQGVAAHPGGHRARAAQRGVVLVIALVTSVALAAAALALVRASTVAASVGSNVHARRQAALAASAAIERAVVDLLRDARIDPRADDPAHNYFATLQPGEDARGVRRVVRHVIERSCVAAGDAARETCALSPPSIEAAQGMPGSGEPPRQPSFRVSVRVDGPSGAALHAVALLSASHPNPRVSMRILDE